MIWDLLGLGMSWFVVLASFFGSALSIRRVVGWLDLADMSLGDILAAVRSHKRFLCFVGCLLEGSWPFTRRGWGWCFLAGGPFVTVLQAKKHLSGRLKALPMRGLFLKQGAQQPCDLRSLETCFGWKAGFPLEPHFLIHNLLWIVNRHQNPQSSLGAAEKRDRSNASC